MPTKTELEDRLEELEDQLDAVVDVLLDPKIEDENERVAEALAVADTEVVE